MQKFQDKKMLADMGIIGITIYNIKCKVYIIIRKKTKEFKQNIFKVASDLGGVSPDQELPGGGKRKEVNLLPGTGKEQQNILII